MQKISFIFSVSFTTNIIKKFSLKNAFALKLIKKSLNAMINALIFANTIKTSKSTKK